MREMGLEAPPHYLSSLPKRGESCPRQGKVAIIPMIAYEIMEVFAELLKWPKGVHFPKAKPWL